MSLIKNKSKDAGRSASKGSRLDMMRLLNVPIGTKKNISSDFDVLELSAALTKASVDSVAGYLGVTRKNLAEKILNLSVKTIERKTPRAKLDKRLSSHVIEIARVLEHASEVFEDEEKIKRWLHKENRALNNKKPVDMLDTLSGINMVDDILGRIEEGVYT